MLKIKKTLNDIIKNTYVENINPAYYKFYIEISNEVSKTKHGYYNEKNQKIKIYNTYRDDDSVLCTTIHELAHHIDYCNRHTSDHQKPFYAVYRKLLYTAMDMGIIDKYKFLSIVKDATDYSKVLKMMEEYVPNPIEYKKNVYLISVYDCYAIKDILKEKGYHYNGNTSAWEKEIMDVEEEKVWLSQFEEIRIEITNANKIHFNGHIKLIAKENSFPYKEELKKVGFKYKNSQWIYESSNMKEAKSIIKQFPKIKFIIK